MQTTDPITFTAEDGTHWFANQTDLDPLSIGASLTLPLAPTDQSVWVANSNGEYNQSGGKAEPDFENGQHHTNNANWLRFDVHSDAILESVEVYSGGGGTATIEIVNAFDVVVSTTSQLLYGRCLNGGY